MEGPPQSLCLKGPWFTDDFLDAQVEEIGLVSRGEDQGRVRPSGGSADTDDVTSGQCSGIGCHDGDFNSDLGALAKKPQCFGNEQNRIGARKFFGDGPFNT